MHHGHAAAAPHQHHFVNVVGGEARIAQSLLEGCPQPAHQVTTEAIKLRSAEAGFNVLGAIGGGGNKGQTDLGAGHARQFNLGLFRCLGQPLEGLAVFAQVNALGL